MTLGSADLHKHKVKRHHYHSFLNRGIYSLLLILVVMGIGTWGVRYFEKVSYLEAFYFMSMIATSQGPSYTPVTVGGKLFFSFIAFISVGTVVASLGFLFGPFFGKLLKIGVYKFEEELFNQKDT